MTRFYFLLALFLLVGCEDRKNVLLGRQGEGCYFNGTCDDGLICIRWKNADKSDKSVCADPKSLNIGGFLVPKSCQDCPACPVCAPLPKPVVCPRAPDCPILPVGPCQVCPPCAACPACAACLPCAACEPGWKRPVK